MKAPRRAFMVLSSKALPYAFHCVETLLRNCVEDVALTLITDDAADKLALEHAFSNLSFAGKTLKVADKAEADARARETFANYPEIMSFREGHPCWRKITDPLAFSGVGDEAIILDPDLYFPNRFSFESTPETGVLLMRQGPNCLYPPEAVAHVFDAAVQLADHTDIGVAQLRAGAVDLAWLDNFLRRFNWRAYATYMHIESIVWAALAMRMGGGYFSPSAWRCWERGQVKRILIAAGAPGSLLLGMEPLQKLKCIHVSGPSKWWVVEAVAKGALRETGKVYDKPTKSAPYQEYTRGKFERSRRLKAVLRGIGYYKLTKSE